MTLPNDYDLCELVLEADFDGTEQVLNVFQFRPVATSWTTEAEFISDLKDLAEAIIDVMKAIATAYTVWRRLRFRNVTQDTATLVVDLDTAIPGTKAGDSLPPGVAMLLGFRTEQPKTLLKKYLGIPAESALYVDGRYTGTALGDAIAVGTLLMDPIVGLYANWIYGHWHAPTATFLEPTAFYVDARPAYQRRRRRGSGS